MAKRPPKPNKRVGIPEVRMPDVLRLSAEGKSCRDISAWLATEHGIEVNHTTIARRIRETRDERRVAIGAAVAEKVAQSATSDLDVLADLQRHLLALWVKHKDGEDVRAALLVARELREVTTTKLKAAGVGDDNAAPTADARAALLAKMKRLAGADKD